MKVLSPIDWLEQNKDKYPNGSIVSEMMQDYAEYYHEETSQYNTLIEKRRSEWHSSHELKNIKFEK